MGPSKKGFHDMETTIRNMLGTDVPEVSRLVCRSFVWGAERDRVSQEAIVGYIEARGAPTAIQCQFEEYHCLVAEDEHVVVGLVAVSGDEVSKLYVDPERMGRGVGRFLFECAERMIRDGGYREMRLVTMFPSTVAFYGKLGMSVKSRGVADHGPCAGCATIVMTKPLDNNPTLMRLR